MRINESLMPLYLWPLYLWSPLNQRSLTFFHIRISVSSATPEAQSHAPYVMTQKRDPILQISHSMGGPGHSSMELCCSVMITPHSKYRTWPQAGLLYSLQHTAYSLWDTNVQEVMILVIHLSLHRIPGILGCNLQSTSYCMLPSPYIYTLHTSSIQVDPHILDKE